MLKSLEEHGFNSTIQQRTNLKDLQNMLLSILFITEEPKKVISCNWKDPSWIEAMLEELLQFKLQEVWTLVDLPYRKRAIGTKWIFRNKKDERGIMIRNKQKKDGIFISQDKYVGEILKKFGFTEVKTASTQMETQKPLLKDEDGEEVDVHMYRSMIGSLMYLTSLRLDIMFAVCACARYKVNPKVSHLHAIKRIFRYLKGQPKLGLWYPKDSPFDLVAYTDSDYAGASLDRKFTTEGCQFLGCRLISWQCKKQTVVANSTTEAEYMAASSCDANLKLLRSLPSAWNNIALIMRNIPDLDELSMDDLYNNLKHGPAVASVSTEGPIPPKTAEQKIARKNDLKAKSTLLLAIPDEHLIERQASSSTYADDVMLSFFINQSKSPLLDNKDMEQIDSYNLEEMDFKWQVAMLTIRINRFIKKTRRNLNLNGKEAVGLDMTKVECYNYHRKGHFARDCRAPRNQGNRNGDNARRVVPVETSANALVVQDGIGYQMGFESLEARIVFHEKNEASYEESIAFLKYDVQSEGYHEVPPPFTGNFKPTRADLSFAGLDDSVYKSKVSETITSVPNVETTVTKTSKDSLEKPKNVRFSAPIIEDWESDSEDENVNSTVEKPKKLSQNPRDNKRNRNSFEFTKKDCFVCGSFNHLIKDCDFHDKRMVQKPMLNNVKKGTGQRKVRQVWNNALRVNHQNFSNFRQDFAPTTVLTKSGIVPISAARQSSSRAASLASAARPINTVAPKPFVNVTRPRPNAFHKSHSPSRTPFNQQTTLKNKNCNNKVNIAKVYYVNTTKGNKVTSAVGEQGISVVKSSACWIWRPKGNVIDHISKDSGSYMPKRFDYCHPQYALQDQGIFESRFSRHMTGNKFYISDYQDIDGGFVAFGGSSKGGKITGKGKIRTEKLDFEDVYFVKELKFNLFSVSQMCDKKNNVLFTETECLVLSPDFKLQSQVLLKTPRQNNMYSFDLKNVVPSGDLTCLFAKAIIDESNLWHRRLGHINFKTMNKLVRGNLVRGLPSKPFENNHTYVAYQKGKQHKASCKTKTVSSICKPLQLLHMDLFVPVSVRSINRKSYCLVVTDDFNHKVKTIRSDNGTEFKNRIMNEFCDIKDIRREFSVARTP
ncbi:putative ribonuclease H-like domain-containing protein [Tanacetum coccineum]